MPDRPAAASHREFPETAWLFPGPQQDVQDRQKLRLDRVDYGEYRHTIRLNRTSAIPTSGRERGENCRVLRQNIFQISRHWAHRHNDRSRAVTLTAKSVR